MKRLLVVMLAATLLFAAPAFIGAQGAPGKAAQTAKGTPAAAQAAKGTPATAQAAKGTPATAQAAKGTPATAQAAKPAYTVTAANQPLVMKSAETITGAQLKDYLSFVASDEMEGRLAPSRGLDTAAKFLATMASHFGAKPAGDDGTFFQHITLKKEKVIAEETQVQLGGSKFAFGKDFLAMASGGSASGAMVFAGDGWFVKPKNIDPYQDIDPKGKIVILSQAAPAGMARGGRGMGGMGGGLPPGVTREELSSMKSGEDYMDPVAYAKAKGAVAIIRINPLLTQLNTEMMDRLRRFAEEGSYSPEKFATGASQGLPTITANAALVQAIFSGEPTDGNTVLASTMPKGTPIKAFALSAEKKISFAIKTAAQTTPTQNVVAVFEGSDPVLKNEYVALGAHYDHLGIGTPINGDAIRNGADDDGTGTCALLAIAEALSKAPRRPKRSVLIVWHTGEEEGLWGSRYFTMFPTVPLDKIVVQLNIDMIGRSKAEGDTNARNSNLSGPNEVYVIGAKMMSNELGALSETVNEKYLNMALNYKYDDPKDPNRFFYRSDHINYARKNIPIIFYFTGVHADYHQPSDEVAKIDFVKYERVTRTVYATAWEIAEMKTRLKVDNPLPENMRGN